MGNLYDVLINGVRSFTKQFTARSRPSIPSAVPKYEIIPVDGRNGSLTRFMGYDDVPLSIEFNILFQKNVKRKWREIKAFLQKAKTLSFTDDPDFHRKVKQVSINATENEVENSGIFTVDFVLDPFEYQNTQKTIHTASPFNLNNPGTENSVPLIHVYGTGDITLRFNGVGVTLHNLTDEIILDCDLEEAYKGSTTNMNDNMSGEFPEFKSGTNQISFTGNVSKIEIDGRWRYV